MNLEANPVVKGVGAIAGLLVIFAGANSYFATAGDITRLESSWNVGQLRLEIGQLEGQKRQVENAMFDAKDPKSRERYKLQVDQLQQEKLSKQRRLDEITTPVAKR